MIERPRMALVVIGLSAVLVSACSDDTPAANSGSTASELTAKAVLASTGGGSAVEGTAVFVEKGDETTVTVTITAGGGAPGEHGLHIHEKGSCDPVDGGPGLAAGGHWNPVDAGHGYPSATPHHLGDLGNITIDAEGKGTVVVKSKDFYVHDGPNSVVGHTVIYHAQKDDGVSQPVGNAGARPGCGVIQKQ